MGSQPRNFLCVEILKQICLPSLGSFVFHYYYYYYYYYYKWSFDSKHVAALLTLKQWEIMNKQ